MITLITGVPGSGKTLYALNMVKARADKEGRKVYQNGIPDLVLPWEVLDDPERWHEVPAGSIVVIDECQRVFRPRGTGSAVPEHVAKLETHRHAGIDVVLITQHPMLVDTNVRRLVGQHLHAVRRFGLQKAVVHEWVAVSEITESAIAEAVRHDFAYPVESFGWYKSAEVHTHKRRIPFRLVFLWLSPLVVVGLAWVAYRQVEKFMAKPNPISAPIVSAAGVKGDQATTLAASVGKAPMDTATYVGLTVPRIPGLPHTAPKYDELTKPSRVPTAVACVSSSTKCKCYSQDGTWLGVPDQLCRHVAENGTFIDYEPNGRSSVAAAPKGAGATNEKKGDGDLAGGSGARAEASSAKSERQESTPRPAFKLNDEATRARDAPLGWSADVTTRAARS